MAGLSGRYKTCTAPGGVTISMSMSVNHLYPFENQLIFYLCKSAFSVNVIRVPLLLLFFVFFVGNAVCSLSPDSHPYPCPSTFSVSSVCLLLLLFIAMLCALIEPIDACLHPAQSVRYCQSVCRAEQRTCVKYPNVDEYQIWMHYPSL